MGMAVIILAMVASFSITPKGKKKFTCFPYQNFPKGNGVFSGTYLPYLLARLS